MYFPKRMGVMFFGISVAGLPATTKNKTLRSKIEYISLDNNDMRCLFYLYRELWTAW